MTCWTLCWVHTINKSVAKERAKAIEDGSAARKDAALAEAAQRRRIPYSERVRAVQNAEVTGDYSIAILQPVESKKLMRKTKKYSFGDLSTPFITAKDVVMTVHGGAEMVEIKCTATTKSKDWQMLQFIVHFKGIRLAFDPISLQKMTYVGTAYTHNIKFSLVEVEYPQVDEAYIQLREYRDDEGRLKPEMVEMQGSMFGGMFGEVDKGQYPTQRL